MQLQKSSKLAYAAFAITLFSVKLLFVGDIVGEPGRHCVRQLLPKLRQAHQIDMVIANGENSAGGAGITVNTANEIFDAGVDIMTTGDHLWDQKEVNFSTAGRSAVFAEALELSAGCHNRTGKHCLAFQQDPAGRRSQSTRANFHAAAGEPFPLRPRRKCRACARLQI